MTPRTKVVAAAAAALALALAGAVLLRARTRAPHRAADQRPPLPLQLGDAAPRPAVWVDVGDPERAWKAIRASAWVRRVLSEPLGQGFSGGWSAFLGTRGADLADAFEGTVAELVGSRLLSDPMRVVFYGGPEATGAAVVLVPQAGSSARAAFDVLDGAARSGRYEASRCPGDKADLPEKLVVSRWLVADHAVFAGRRADAMALAKNPVAVAQALCAAPPALRLAPPEVAVSFAPDALGREAQLGAALLGLGPAPRLLFEVEGDRLAPRGIAGELSEPERLVAAAPPEALLRLVPGDAGLVLLATVNLPPRLDRASLREHLARRPAGPLLPRTVALVWNPRAGRATEVALAWPERDAAELEDAFTGPNRMERRRACGHLVLASSGGLATAMERACAGLAPSILNAAPAVAAGVRQPMSLAVNLNLGQVLSQLLADARAGERPSGQPSSPEIESARRLLEELPCIGLRGVAKGGALVPGGFRS